MPLLIIRKEDVAVDTNKASFDSLVKYFNVLGETGYISNSITDSLIIYLFINDILTGPLGQYVTEEDYKTILQVVDCLKDGCIIPFEVTRGDMLYGVWPYCSIRVTDTGSFMLNTNNNFRLNVQS